MQLDKVVDLTLNTSDSEESGENHNFFLSNRERERMNLIKEFNNHSKLVLGSAGAQLQDLQDPRERLNCISCVEIWSNLLFRSEDVHVHELDIQVDHRESKMMQLQQVDLEAAKRSMIDGIQGSFVHVRRLDHFYRITES